MSSSSKMRLELSGKKRAILEALLREQGIGAARTDRIPRRTEGPALLSSPNSGCGSWINSNPRVLSTTYTRA